MAHTRQPRCTKSSSMGPYPPSKSKICGKQKLSQRLKFSGGLVCTKQILTTDNLDVRGMQHYPSCPLCYQAHEDARHLLINYPFSKEVLRLVWTWYSMAGTASSFSGDEDPASWLCSNARKGMAGNQVKASGSSSMCGGTYGKKETREFLMQCSILNFKWLSRQKKRSSCAPQHSPLPLV
jgi:hypothetical protein